MIVKNKIRTLELDKEIHYKYFSPILFSTPFPRNFIDTFNARQHTRANDDTVSHRKKICVNVGNH